MVSLHIWMTGRRYCIALLATSQYLTLNPTCDIARCESLKSVYRMLEIGQVASMLTSTSWFCLVHLDLLGLLCLSYNGSMKTLLNLASLSLTISNRMSRDASSSKLFLLPWLNLKKLYVDYKFNCNIHFALCNAVRQ